MSVQGGERYLWLGQSARTTVVTRAYPQLASARWMASLGDAIHRPRMLETVFGRQLKTRLAITGPLMLDSGGFTMMMREGDLSLAQVARAFGAADADVLVSLDYPPLGTDPVEVRQAKYANTLANFTALHRDLARASLAPVVHGVTVAELEANCEAIRRVDSAPAWVCLGGLVPLLRQCGQVRHRAAEARQRLAETIRLVRDAFPASRLHALGVGSPRNIAAAFASGADSVDSIGWRRAAGFGTIFLPSGTERFVAHRDRKRAGSRRLLDDVDRALLGACDCPVCLGAGGLEARIEALAASYLPRAAHNAWIVLGETRAVRAPLVARVAESSQCGGLR
jgi:tRNA-guanine family transglycosylase